MKLSYVYIYIYIYIYMYMYICIYIYNGINKTLSLFAKHDLWHTSIWKHHLCYIHIDVHIHIYIRVKLSHIHILMQTYESPCMYTDMLTSWGNILVHLHTNKKQIRRHTHEHVHSHTHTWMYSHIHTFTSHTCVTYIVSHNVLRLAKQMRIAPTEFQ